MYAFLEGFIGVDSAIKKILGICSQNIKRYFLLKIYSLDVSVVLTVSVNSAFILQFGSYLELIQVSRIQLFVLKTYTLDGAVASMYIDSY